jgi:hypothetical protein
MAGYSQAIDSIGPAFERTIKQLFKPFRLGHWLRLSVVSLLTWEFAGGGLNINIPSPSDGDSSEELLEAIPNLPLIVAAVLAIVVLSLFLTYVAAVFRFILFESVLTDRCQIAEGWSRWQRHGRSLFWWWIAYTVVMLLVILVLVALPVGLAWMGGIFDAPGDHLFLLVGGGVILFFMLMVTILASMVVHLAVKDWVVPLMAMENLGVLGGWQRLIPMFRVNWPAYLLFVLMKALLALGSAIFFTILYIILALVVLVPFLLTGIIAGLFGQAAGITWSPLLIAAVSIIGGIALVVVLYGMAFLYTPGMVFFQSYALYFFGTQYPRLGEALAGPDSTPHGV